MTSGLRRYSTWLPILFQSLTFSALGQTPLGEIQTESGHEVQLALGRLNILKGCAALQGVERDALVLAFSDGLGKGTSGNDDSREGRELEEGLQALIFACHRLHSLAPIGNATPATLISISDRSVEQKPLHETLGLMIMQSLGGPESSQKVGEGRESGPRRGLADKMVDVTRNRIPWLFYYLKVPSIWSLQMLINVALLLLVVGLFEAFFLRSTLLSKDFWGPVSSRRSQPPTAAIAETRPDEPGPGAAGRQKLFWDKAAEALRRSQGVSAPYAPSVDPLRDVIGFTQHTFSGLESGGAVTIGIERRGACTSELRVKVRTASSAKSAYAAAAGVDYKDVELEIGFLPGQRLMSFEVPIYQSQDSWSLTRWFRVELVEILTGSADFGGPTVSRWQDEDGGEDMKPAARALILQEDVFPFGLPAECFKSPFWLAVYYLRDRVQARGAKYWKTMAALLYDPFHKVVVTGLVQRKVINLAVDYKHYQMGIYERLFMLAMIQLLSTFLLRWGNQVQTMNRGRTGGVRMQHRWQLFSKLMMMEFSDQWRVPGSTWFYTAIQNVESVTVDGYWQSFQLMIGVFGLALSISTLLLTSHGPPGASLAGTTLMLICGPIAGVWIYLRRDRVADMLEQRMHDESKWVETLSWLAHAGPSLHSLGPRDFAWLEQRFSAQSKEFVAKHQKARDLINDSLWVIRWLAAGSYCLILIWGSNKLVYQQERSEHGFSVGHYVLVLKLYLAFGKYTDKISHSCVQLQRSAVSIKRLAELLNMQEHRSMRTQAMSQLISRDDVPDDRIELQEVEFTIPRRYSRLSPVVPLRIESVSTVVPLWKVVHVIGGSENSRMTFLALISSTIQPSRGKLLMPSSTSAIFLQPVQASLRPPKMTVLQALMLTGATEAIAQDFAQVLGINPSAAVTCLAAGQQQMLSLACALLRDPEMLVLMRPLSLVDSSLRPKLRMLLRIWQQHGSLEIVNLLSDMAGRHRPQAGVKHQRQRTLVITGEDMEDDSDLWQDSDVLIDLDKVLSSSSPVPDSSSDCAMEPTCKASQ